VIFDNFRRRADDLPIERGDAVGGLERYIEFHKPIPSVIGPKPLIGFVASEAIAPRADRFDVSVMLFKSKLVSRETCALWSAVAGVLADLE